MNTLLTPPSSSPTTSSIYLPFPTVGTLSTHEGEAKWSFLKFLGYFKLFFSSLGRIHFLFLLSGRLSFKWPSMYMCACLCVGVCEKMQWDFFLKQYLSLPYVISLLYFFYLFSFLMAGYNILHWFNLQKLGPQIILICLKLLD